MILVPNHQRLLNGSKWLFIAFMGLLWLQACDGGKRSLDTVQTSTTGDTTKQTPQKQQPPKETSPVVKRPVVDTIFWCDTVPSSPTASWVICYTKVGHRPIQIDTVNQLSKGLKPAVRRPVDTVKMVLKDRYQIAVVLPFAAGKRWGGEVHPSSLRALEFYEGMKLALDSLQLEGMKLDVHVFDTRADVAQMKSLLELKTLQQADLIIGPLTRSNSLLLNEHGKRYGIPILSPFNPRDDLNEAGHEAFFQASPPFERYSKKIVEHCLYNRTARKNILILASPTAADSARVQQLQRAFNRHPYSSMHSISVHYSSSQTNFSIRNIRDRFSKVDSNMVIVPSYKEEGFIYAVLRELSTLKDSEKRYRNYPVRVYGLPQWMAYEKVEYKYYEDLDLHVANDYYVNSKSKKVQAFEQHYFDTYGMPPREYGYMGFDMTLFFGRLLQEFGSNFRHFLQYHKPRSYFHTKFRFEPIYAPGTVLDGPAGRTEAKGPIRYENSYLHILRFKDYRLQPAGK